MYHLKYNSFNFEMVQLAE